MYIVYHAKKQALRAHQFDGLDLNFILIVAQEAQYIVNCIPHTIIMCMLKLQDF